jgi:lipopolysaccharide transport system permease protein
MSSKQDWDIIIKPDKKWFDFRLKELWAYRDLILLFVRRDFVAYYKQTILGPLWFFIQPIFTTVMYVIVFGRIAKIPTAGIPAQVFYLAGIINWTYFSDCVTKTSNTFIINTAIFGKVYFPRLIVPLSIIVSNLITYGIQLLLFVIVLAYNMIANHVHVQVSPMILIFPMLILQIAMFGFGVGVIVSSLTTKYKDLSFAIIFGIQLWMYATPIVYPLSQVPAKWQSLFYLNPMASIIEIFRNMLFDTGAVNWTQYGYSWIITIATMLIGVSLFNRVEKSFMDTV